MIRSGNLLALTAGLERLSVGFDVRNSTCVPNVSILEVRDFS